MAYIYVQLVSLKTSLSLYIVVEADFFCKKTTNELEQAIKDRFHHITMQLENQSKCAFDCAIRLSGKTIKHS